MKSNKFCLKLLMLFLIQIKLVAMQPVWYETNDGQRFLIDTEQKYNWYQAWNECARYDAQLIAIESEEKNQVVMKLLRNLHEKTKNLWISGNVLYQKVSFLWAVNEQEFTYTNWATEDVNKFDLRKQCVYLMRYGKNIPWNIADCDAKVFGFICEESLTGDEVAKDESVRRSDNLQGSMYSGSIYGLIG